MSNNVEMSLNKPMIYSYKSSVDAGTFVRLRSDIQFSPIHVLNRTQSSNGILQVFLTKIRRSYWTHMVSNILPSLRTSCSPTCCFSTPCLQALLSQCSFPAYPHSSLPLYVFFFFIGHLILFLRLLCSRSLFPLLQYLPMTSIPPSSLPPA